VMRAAGKSACGGQSERRQYETDSDCSHYILPALYWLSKKSERIELYL